MIAIYWARSEAGSAHLIQRFQTDKKVAAAPARRGWRFPLLPQLVDTYVLTQFLFYLVLMLASFVFMTQIFTFFELLGDIVRNKISMLTVVEYLFFLTPQLIYETLPISVLVAVLVTFGVLTKHNEVTAFKASGVSLYRLTMPVLLAAMVLSAGLFAFDYYYVPPANRRQDALRDKIKGRAGRRRICGRTASGSRAGVAHLLLQVFRHDGKHHVRCECVRAGCRQRFDLKREITAERAQWQPSLRKWIFQNGWRSEILGSAAGEPPAFRGDDLSGAGRAAGLLPEGGPAQDTQMNFRDLDATSRTCSRADSTRCICGCSCTRSSRCRCSR